MKSVHYCRVLTQQAGLPESDQCYDDPQSPPKDAEENPRHSAVHLDRQGFRLPTEAEWEFVSRCGMRTTYGFGSDPRLLTHYGWFQDNSKRRSHAAGLLRPNLRGLFDVHGNVDEWCQDWYGDLSSNDAADPTGAETGNDRVLRGGGWGDSPQYCRSAYRLGIAPSDQASGLGFRVLRSSVFRASPVKN